MAEYTAGKYIQMLKNKLNEKQLIEFAEVFGFNASVADSLTRCKISYNNDYICVYAERHNFMDTEILDCVTFYDFYVSPSGYMAGTKEYHECEENYRSFVATLLKDEVSTKDYAKDFESFVNNERKRRQQQHEQQLLKEYKNLYTGLGLIYNEPTKEK